jgi:hypothetical protein
MAVAGSPALEPLGSSAWPVQVRPASAVTKSLVPNRNVAGGPFVELFEFSTRFESFGSTTKTEFSLWVTLNALVMVTSGES